MAELYGCPDFQMWIFECERWSFNMKSKQKRWQVEDSRRPFLTEEKHPASRLNWWTDDLLAFTDRFQFLGNTGVATCNVW